MMRAILKIFLAVMLYVGMEQLIEKQTRGFGVSRIQAKDLGVFAACESNSLSDAEKDYVKELLKQPYHLIGSGSECFAFLSEDGTAVIKFFKLDVMRPVYIKRTLFSNDYSKYADSFVKYRPTGLLWDLWLKRLWGMREYRIQRSFGSIQIAYESLKEETGLLYIHLNEGKEFENPLTLYDGSHIAHHIDLNTTRFVLQKRAVPLPQYLDSLTNDEQAKESIDSLLNLISTRCLRAIQDRDMEPRNFGYIAGRAIEIDTGSFSKNGETQDVRMQFMDAARKLKTPFQERFPHLSSYFDTQVEQCALNIH
jgi:hypothetical protein